MMTRRILRALALCMFWPWGSAALDVSAPPPIEQDFAVTLPEREETFPRPLPEGQPPGFAMRGTKGWLWLPEQYLAEIPTLAAYKMNFLMVCYGSMCDIEHYAWGDPDCNRWWEPLPEEKRRVYERVLEVCQAHGIELCLSVNPNLFSKRILDYDNVEDVDALWQHYAWMQERGMKWFCISLDDIREGINAAGQAKVTNDILRRLRAHDANAQLILCPTFYWGAGENDAARRYLETLAKKLNKDVFLFWTGNAVVTPVITREAAAAYKGYAGHRLFIWDNYPVNDAQATLHLGPVTGRDPDLCGVCYGYMSNPLHAENEINRIPLLTCADYAYNPWQYDPAWSIGQAIVHIGATEAQREVLRDLVELFPGMLLYGQGTGWNPVLARFNEIMDIPHSRYLAEVYLRHVEHVVQRFDGAFPGRFDAAKKTLGKTLDDMRSRYAAHYGHPPRANE